MGYGMRVDSESLDKVLRRHEVRHGGLILILVMAPFMSSIADRVNEEVEDFEDVDALKDWVVAVLEPFADEIAGRITEFEDLFCDNADVDWWSDAAHAKNRGLYVDFDAGSWRTPQESGALEYQDARPRAEYVFGKILPFVDEWLSYDPEAAPLVRSLVEHVKEPFTQTLSSRYEGTRRIAEGESS